MILFYTILFIMLWAFITFLIQKFRKDKAFKRKFYDFGDGNFLVYTLFVLIVSYFLVIFLMNEPHFESKKEQIDYGNKTAQPWLVSSGYQSLLSKDSLDLDVQFFWIQAHFSRYQKLCPSPQKYDDEGTSIFDYYTRLTQLSDPVKVDIGNLFLGIYYYMKDDKDNSRSLLDRVNNRKLKYLNVYAGMNNYYFQKHIEAKENLFQEIKLKGYVEGAYHYLALIYEHEFRDQDLKSLVYNEASSKYVPYELRTSVYIKNNDVSSYFKDLFKQIFRNTNIIGFSGALLILLIWVMYLHRVNLNRKKSLFSSFLAVLLSAVLVLPVWLLYDFYKYALHFDLDGGFVHDFFYCVFGIGAIEELVKIFPFLLILWFTKAIKEPIDYIMYASLSALGFAFVENFRYFQDGSLNIMHSRALTASISHMIDSSIVAYGLILAKFKYKKHPLLFFAGFFLIAVFSHGFYDFWLLNDTANDYYIITFLYLLTSILVYASFINNALNNSTSPEQNIQLNSARLSNDLAASLIGIFLFEFLCLSFIYGPTIGNRELITSSLSGGYLILFLSVRLSNIDVFPGDWPRLDFFVGLLPMQIIYGGKKPNYNSALGSNIRLRVLRKKGKLAEVLPVEGEIVKREKISGFTGWFLVKLSKPLPYLKLDKEYILIRAKSPIELIGREEEVIVHFVSIPDKTALDKSVKKDEDFKFMDWVIASKTPVPKN